MGQFGADPLPWRGGQAASGRAAGWDDIAVNDLPVRYGFERRVALDDDVTVFVQAHEVVAFLAGALSKQLHGESGAQCLEVSPGDIQDVIGV